MLAGIDLAVLAAIAFATSAFTAVVGLGGGIVLLTVMLFYFDPLAAIPLHGVIQIVSNSSRTYIQRRHVRWAIFGRAALLLFPAGVLGLRVARGLPPEAVKLAIGLFVLVTTWAPRALLLGFDPASSGTLRHFYLLGGVVGFLNVTIGATGPLQGPFFANAGLDRRGVVGTFAACQTAGHLVKIVLFGLAGFAFADYLLPLALLSAMVVVGTRAGSLLLDRVDERTFRWLYRVVLTAIALRLVVWDGLRALA